MPISKKKFDQPVTRIQKHIYDMHQKRLEADLESLDEKISKLEQLNDKETLATH